MQRIHSKNCLTLWCKERGFFIPAGPKKGPKIEETHLFLDGGRLLLPDENNAEFLRKMAEAIVIERAWLYVVEMKTDPGRLFIEIDLILWDRRLTDDEVSRDLMAPFCRAVQQAYPLVPQGCKAVVCRNEPTVVEKDGTREKVKNGVHVVWPNVIVDKEKAWLMRALFLYELYQGGVACIRPEEMCEPWEKAIDPCVFGKNGLRMTWNRKAATCKVCRGIPFQTWTLEKRKAGRSLHGKSLTEQTVRRPDIKPCEACNTFDNKVDMGRPYDLVAVCGLPEPEAASELRRLRGDPLAALIETSIRVVAPRGHAMPLILPEVMQLLIRKYAVKAGNRDLTVTNAIKRRPDCELPPKKRRCDGSKALVSLDSSSEEYILLAEFVAREANCCTIMVKATEEKHCYIVNTNSHECRNKGGEHTSSTVYYVFQPDAWYQKCWCRNGKVYSTGGVSCADYRGPLVPYPPDFAAQVSKIFSHNSKRRFPYSMSVSYGDDRVYVPFVPPALPTSEEMSYADRKKAINDSLKSWMISRNAECHQTDEEKKKK